MSRDFSWVFVLLLSLFAGGVAGFVVSQGYLSPQVRELESSLRARMDQAASTGTKPQVQVVRVEREPAAPVIPAVFAQGRRSPLLTLMKRSERVGEDPMILPSERISGFLLALTVDGWLVGPASAFEGVRVNDLAVVVEGRLYPFVKAIKDTSTQLVYVKIDAQNLPVTSFAPVEDVRAGLPVWIEMFPGRVSPHVIVDARERGSRVPLPAEYFTRRYVVNGASGLPKGAGVWDGAGQLVGLAEGSGANGLVIPVTTVSATLSSLLTQNEIRRTTLGVAGLETASVVFDKARPVSGFLLRSDKIRGVTAVDPKGPSAKLLKEGDVIERVERDVLDGSAHLGERLLPYRAGTVLNVYGQRGGQMFQGQVTLGSTVTSEILK